MARLALLTVLALVAGCASWPQPGTPAQCPPARSAQALLSLAGAGENPRRLILHTRPSTEAVRYVGVDTVGSPLFTARWSAADWQVEATGLYRGPDAAALVGGYQWWQSRRELRQSCLPAGLTLERRDVGLTIRRGGRTLWRWQSSQDLQFELPRQGVTVTVRETP